MTIRTLRIELVPHPEFKEFQEIRGILRFDRNTYEWSEIVRLEMTPECASEILTRAVHFITDKIRTAYRTDQEPIYGA